MMMENEWRRTTVNGRFQAGSRFQLSRTLKEWMEMYDMSDINSKGIIRQ
jgi:hypothetical protein